MPDFNERVFFQKIANDLHEKGVLKTYEKPLGAQRGWGRYSKHAHDDKKKDTPGLVFHPGDEPYNMLTTAQIQYYKELDIKPEDFKLRAASVMKAIRAYIPDDDFEKYLTFFTENIKKPSHQAALKTTYNNITKQLSLEGGRTERMSLNELERVITVGEPNFTRASLAQSTLSQDMANQPELLLSIAIYQAAQVSYLDQLQQAIDNHPNITKDEKNNANAVFEEPFKQFKTSLIFATLAPLTLLARQKMGGVPGKTEDELMLQSISSGWQSFFDTKVLTRTYSEQEVPTEKGAGSSLTCPAINLLRASKNKGSVEKIYSYVAAHREELKDELQQVTRAAQAIESKIIRITGKGSLNDEIEFPDTAHETQDKPVSRCPVKRMGGFAALALASSMISGHDMPPVDKPSPEPKIRDVRKWSDTPPADKNPPPPGKTR